MQGVQPRVGYADLLSMPEDGRRYEIHGGELVVVPSPLPRHRIAALATFTLLREHTAAAGGIVLAAPLDIVFAEHDVVQLLDFSRLQIQSGIQSAFSRAEHERPRTGRNTRKRGRRRIGPRDGDGDDAPEGPGCGRPFASGTTVPAPRRALPRVVSGVGQFVQCDDSPLCVAYASTGVRVAPVAEVEPRPCL